MITGTAFVDLSAAYDTVNHRLLIQKLYNTVVRVNEWKRRLEEKAHAGLVNLYDDLATGHDSSWLNWRCLNRLRTGYTCSKEQRKKWGYFNGDTTCECGLATENTSHMLQCSLLAHPCTLDDLLEFNDTAPACTERWKKIV